MSATGIALLSSEIDTRIAWATRREKWWDRWTSRCAGPDCPHRDKLWPALLHLAPGVEFDGRWYCELGCLRKVLSLRVQSLLSISYLEKPRVHRLPIGLLLVNRGVISHEQLREAVRLQREAGHGKLGDWLRQTAALNDQQLTAALGQQWGCPVFPLEQQVAQLTWSDLLPIPVLESAQAVPAHASADGHVLHVAFGERLDHTMLYAIEQMLRCRTFPCVASKAAISAQLEQLRRHAARNETSFDTVREPREMTATICNYAAELGASRLVVVRAGAFVWVRFYRGNSTRDLLFRILPGGNPGFERRSSPRTKAFSISADTRKDGVSHATTPL